MALTEGGYDNTQLYFEQLTPLVILSQTADETGKTVAQVEDETNKALENPATQNNPGDQTTENANMQSEPVAPPNLNFNTAFFEQEYEIYK
jgi:hypothetical protein